MMKITKEMTIEEIFEKFPQKSQRLAQEMSNLGLNCVGCSASSYETIEAGLLGHGIIEEKIEEFVGRLNQILEEKVDKKNITLTERAKKKFLFILVSEKKEGWGLRLSERPAGCDGFEYALDFAEKATSKDQTFVSKGVNIYVHENDVERLMGCEIDYIDGLQGAGFKITNPNVKSSCGCGSSHGY